MMAVAFGVSFIALVVTGDVWGAPIPAELPFLLYTPLYEGVRTIIPQYVVRWRELYILSCNACKRAIKLLASMEPGRWRNVPLAAMREFPRNTAS